MQHSCSIPWQKVTQIRSMCSLCHETKHCFLLLPLSPQSWAVSSAHHHTASSLTGQQHPSKAAPPRPFRAWAWGGEEENFTDMTGAITPLRVPARLSQLFTQPYPVTWQTSSFPLLCHKAQLQHSSTVTSAMTHSHLPKAGCTPPRCWVLSMLRPLFRCCIKQLLDG